MSGGELIVILIVALIVFGPNKLPELGRTVGRFMRELNRAMNDVKDQVQAEYRNQPSDAEQDQLRRPPDKPGETPAPSQDAGEREKTGEPPAASPPAVSSGPGATH